MNYESIVRAEIARLLECGQDEVDLTQSLGELGFDSANYLALIAFAEKEFGVRVRPEDLFEHSSLMQTIRYIEGLSGAKSQAVTAKVSTGLKAHTSEAAYSDKDIAIIGASVRVAGAQSLEELESLIYAGTSQITKFPPERSSLEGITVAESYLAGGFIADVDAFDAGFFRVSAREALLMDPQQRISLEAAWDAFENAGLSEEQLSNSKTAVLVGASSFDYYELLSANNETHATHVGTGLSHAIIANRISQYFNLKGESEAIDAACASSMVAILKAVTALRNGEVDLALAGGVNVLASPTSFQIFADAGMLSQDGQCRPFDDAANGYVRGEGAGFLVLKRASDAVRDGDRLLGIIKGGAVQHGGRAQSLTTPNPEAQSQVIVAAYRDAGVDSSDISYVEAHGTATTLGDPIEVKGLQKAFAQLGPSQGQAITIGSIKAQIGHLEAAAGVAGVLKLMTVLNRGDLPASSYLEKINRYIDLSNKDFKVSNLVQSQHMAPHGALRGSVSSFGFGGTNSHLVLEAAPKAQIQKRQGQRNYLFVLSAKSETSLQALSQRLIAAMEIHNESWHLEDLSYTLTRRTALPRRMSVMASSYSELKRKIQAWFEGSQTSALQPENILNKESEDSLKKLAEVWQRGEDISWPQALSELKGTLLSLPPYPFARHRFWVRGEFKETQSVRAVSATQGPQDVQTLVVERVAEISSFPSHRINLEMRLISDLGFDSVMLIEFVAKVSEHHDAAERILPSLLAADVKIEELIANLQQIGALKASSSVVATPATSAKEVTFENSIEDFPELHSLEERFSKVGQMGIVPSYFSVNDGTSNNMTSIDGKRLSNYSSYNYLGLSGDAEVVADTIEAIKKFGTSVSASRILSGEKMLHRELERSLSEFMGCEDALVFVGGHATNVSVIGHLVGPDDVILYDALAHDSILRGAIQSGARRRSFPHNDMEALDAILEEVRPTARRVLIAAEGVYSMDGDIVPLDRLIEIKKKHGAMLFLDEAHSLGVIGSTGRGAGEVYQVNRADVDLWMGSLSKSFASCGGFIAGKARVIQYLKYTTPGFIFSAGITPSNAAAALSAVRKIMREPERVQRLQANGRFFIQMCQARGIGVGLSNGTAIVPVIVGDSYKCMQLKSRLRERGINVDPIVYPAVPEHLARLRFFLTALHTESQIEATVQALSEEMQRMN